MPKTVTPKVARPKLLDRRATLIELAALVGRECDAKLIARFSHDDCAAMEHRVAIAVAKVTGSAVKL